jgi:hypothetical protein
VAIICCYRMFDLTLAEISRLSSMLPGVDCFLVNSDHKNRGRIGSLKAKKQ